MIGSGTIVNASAIVAGSVIGLIAGRGIKEKYQITVINGLALCIMMLGLQMALKSQHLLLTISSLVIGSIIGEACSLEDKLNQFGLWLGSKFSKKGEGTSKKFAEGFLYASLIYCVGAMAIVGSIQDGLSGDPTTLYTKAMLDGLSGIVYAANMGIGVMFSAVSVFLYEGALTLLAGLIGSVMTDTIVQEIAVTGGLLIFGIGINMTKMMTIHVGNMLPSLFVAAVMAYFLL
jgi:uncharacterized membrane protein YqgA involved in biofilm formation